MLKNFKKRTIDKLRNLLKKTRSVIIKPASFFTKDLLIAENVRVGDYTYGVPAVLHWGEEARLEIGKFCSIANEVKIFLGGNHRTDWISTYPFNMIKLFSAEGSKIVGHPATKGDVIIGNDVWIGRGAIILSGITIGNGAVIAASSVVTKEVKPYEIVGGNPAKHIKYRFDEKSINFLNEMEWWNLPEEVIKELIPILSSGDINLLRSKLRITLNQTQKID